MEKRRNCSFGAISPLFHNILLSVIRIPCRKQEPYFYSRLFKLFKISEFEITSVDCNTKRKSKQTTTDSTHAKQTGPEVIKLFSCSTPLSMKFILLINLKLLTIANSSLLNLAEHEHFPTKNMKMAFSNLLAEKISCSAELSMKKVL